MSNCLLLVMFVVSMCDTYVEACVCIYAWNPNDPCFEWSSGLLLEGYPKNRGHSQVPGAFVYIYIQHWASEQFVTILLVRILKTRYLTLQLTG